MVETCPGFNSTLILFSCTCHVRMAKNVLERIG